MPRRPARARGLEIAFTVVWMVFWAAGMVVVVWQFGASALAGEAVPALFMLVWLVVASIGLVSAARRLTEVFTEGDPGPKRSTRKHAWDDGIPPPPPPG